MLMAVKADEEKVKEQTKSYLNGENGLYNTILDIMRGMDKEELGEYVNAVLCAAAMLCLNNNWEYAELFEKIGYQSQEINFE